MGKKFLLFITLAILTFGLLVWLFSDIFLYITISLVIVTILGPPTDYINQTQIFKVEVPRFIAVLLSFLILILVLSIIITLFIPLVSDQVEVLSEIKYEGLLDKLVSPINSLEDFLIINNLTEESPGFIKDNIRESLLSIIEGVNFKIIFNNTISFAGNVFVGIMAIVFITFFLLYEKGLIKKKVIALIPNQYFEVSIAAVFKIEKLLSNYLIGLLFQMFAIFTIASIGLGLLGIKYAVTIALFAAVANLIPYVGPLLGASFGIFVGLSLADYSTDYMSYVLLVVKIISVFTVVQLTDNLVLQPLIFSKSVKAHPLEIFIVIFAGATLAGVLGMVVAIPVYTIIRVSFTELYSGYKQYGIFKLKAYGT